MPLCQKIDSFYKHLIIDWNSTSTLELNKKEKTNYLKFNLIKFVLSL